MYNSSVKFRKGNIYNNSIKGGVVTMFDKNLLKSEIVLKGLNLDSLAKRLETSKATLSKKVNGKSEWKLSEIQEIGKIVGEDKIVAIFFATKVS